MTRYSFRIKKNSISKISNKSLEKSFNYSMKSVKSNEKEHSITLNKNTFKLSIPFNSFFNVNLNFNFMNFSFDCIDQSNIKELLYKIDNNLLFIYDSNILYLLLKHNLDTLLKSIWKNLLKLILRFLHC